MKKGFIRVSKNAEQLQQEIKKLNQHGVPSDSIFWNATFLWYYRN